MALKFKQGDSVSQIVFTVAGTVKSATIVDNDICYLVEYGGADGETHERFFKEDEIEVKGAQ